MGLGDMKGPAPAPLERTEGECYVCYHSLDICAKAKLCDYSFRSVIDRANFDEIVELLQALKAFDRTNESTVATSFYHKAVSLLAKPVDTFYDEWDILVESFKARRFQSKAALLFTE